MANGIVLNIDTTKSEFQNPMIELRQGDGNYQSLDVTVTSNGSPFNLTGWTITFMGTTAGGFKIVDTAVSNVDTANGKFTYTPTKAWGQDEGMFKEAYFKFTSGVNGNSVASGASIRVNVLTAVDLTAEEAGDYISIVDQTIATLNEDLTTLQLSVDQLKAQNNAIKTTDNTWSGSNTFNKKIIATAGFQGNADTATKLQTPRKINGTNFDGTADINVNAANDSSLVHVIGTETIAGNKTFSSPISGRFVSKDVDVTDFNDIAKSMYAHAGIVNVRGTALENGPVTGMTWYTVVVNPSIANDAGNMVAYANDKMFYTGVGSGVVQGWKKLANDNQVVHNTGNETVAGNKTFTGNNIFTQLIDGYTKTKVSPNTDLNLISGSGKYTLTTASTYTNAPSGMPNNAILIVENDKETGSAGDVIYQRVLSRDTINKDNDMTMFFRMRFSNVWSAWKQVAKDGNVIHNTGTETINGDKTFISGNYGLRVTSTGIQKTSDGGTTWTNI